MRVLIINTSNGLKYVYPGNTTAELNAGVYDFLRSQGYTPEDCGDRLAKALKDRSYSIYSIFTEVFENLCESYEVEKVIEVKGGYYDN